MQYAGTGALKSDFTRTGKSTTKGNLKDGVNSLSRYYINNFRDRLRQIGIDVFLGNYSLSNHEESDNDLLDQNGILVCSTHLCRRLYVILTLPRTKIKCVLLTRA